MMALKDFRRRGAACEPIEDPTDPLLLSGRNGQFFLVPVFGTDVGRQYDALRQALAICSIRETQLKARQAGLSRLTMDDINAVIQAVRASRRLRKAAR